MQNKAQTKNGKQSLLHCATSFYHETCNVAQGLLFTVHGSTTNHTPSLSPLSDGTGLPETWDEPPSLMEMTWTEIRLSAALATDNV